MQRGTTHMLKECKQTSLPISSVRLNFNTSAILLLACIINWILVLSAYSVQAITTKELNKLIKQKNTIGKSNL